MNDNNLTLKPAPLSGLCLDRIPLWKRPRPVSKESQKREDRLAAAIRHAAARRATEDAVCRHITELFQQKITAAARRPSGGRMTFVIKS